MQKTELVPPRNHIIEEKDIPRLPCFGCPHFGNQDKVPVPMRDFCGKLGIFIGDPRIERKCRLRWRVKRPW